MENANQQAQACAQNAGAEGAKSIAAFERLRYSVRDARQSRIERHLLDAAALIRMRDSLPRAVLEQDYSALGPLFR